MGAYFYIKWCILLAVVGTVFCGFYLLSAQNAQVEEQFDESYSQVNPKFNIGMQRKEEVGFLPAMEREHVSEPRSNELGAKHGKEEFVTKSLAAEKVKPPSIHIFYYPWYGNPQHDGGKYFHWNHKYLPHWDPHKVDKFLSGHHTPPDDIGASFYPLLGTYSSRDPDIIDLHWKWMSSAGIDVVVVSWFPAGFADDQGQSWEDLMPLLLDASEKYRMKMTFHMEPYKGRDIATIRRDIEYLVSTYGNHSALYKASSKKSSGSSKKKELPVLYFYDSYLIASPEWERVALPDRDLSIRGTDVDVLLIGLIVNLEDKYSLVKSGFDGIYTYFASEGFTYGSTLDNWFSLGNFCRKNGLLFVPSVGPGYDDTRVRPWNAETRKDRNGGQYYARMFQMAHSARADVVSITSFNEWHEGTQIEPAVPFVDNSTGFIYKAYEKGPQQYLHITLDLIKKYFTPLHHIAPAKIVSIV